MTDRVAPAPTGDAAHAAALAGYIRDLLREAPVTPAYRADVAAALIIPGNALSRAPNLRWARLVRTCCGAAGGDWEHARPVAAAVELFMVALDLLDDEEDGDRSALRVTLGSSRVLNASTGLLLLAQQSLLSLPDGAGAAGILLDAGVRARAGQHADLAAGAARCVDIDAALAITAGKSAPLAGAACRLGAWCAGAAAPMQELYARFGGYLGMVAQLTNDLQALRPGGGGKTDVTLGRPTLPLAYMAASARLAGENSSILDPCGPWSDGAAQLTWAVATTYRRHATDVIPELTADPARRAELTKLLDGP